MCKGAFVSETLCDLARRCIKQRGQVGETSDWKVYTARDLGRAIFAKSTLRYFNENIPTVFQERAKFGKSTFFLRKYFENFAFQVRKNQQKQKSGAQLANFPVWMKRPAC